ncbi:MAG: hypothetical protein FJ405_19285, partial [Verrucomicrobia bacterium]|nr:hypothetical protein [Verrucomicrobiota bacterium]
MNPHQDGFSRLAQILETISPKKLSGMLLAFALPFCGIAQETPKPAQVLPPVEEPVQLLLISQIWKSPAPGAIGLPSFSAGFVRFATEDAIHEGPMLLVRPSIWAASWVPGTGESFSYFQRDPDPLNYDMQADARGVAFVGRNRAGQHGIYHYSTNKIERTLVKAASTVPGLSTPFQRLRYPFVQGSRAIFLGESEGNL